MNLPEYEIQSSGPHFTEAIAEALGKRLKGGEIIELSGDVGAGKTTFVRGLAKGIGSEDRVSSPTFTIYQTYKSENINLYHYDFYRIHDFEVISEELKEILVEPTNSIVLEWSDPVSDILPEERIKISIKTTSEEGRQFSFAIPEKFRYVNFEEIEQEKDDTGY